MKALNGIVYTTRRPSVVKVISPGEYPGPYIFCVPGPHQFHCVLAQQTAYLEMDCATTSAARLPVAMHSHAGADAAATRAVS
jgi:hypothetical protein